MRWAQALVLLPHALTSAVMGFTVLDSLTCAVLDWLWRDVRIFSTLFKS